MQETILLVDCAESNLEQITAVLTRDSFHVLTARNGDEALERAREGSPALVLCGQYYDGASSAELCRQVKSPRTRVVLLSSASSVLARAAARDAGFDAVIAAPFNYSDLRTLMGRWGWVPNEERPEEPAVSFQVPLSQHFRADVPPPPPPSQALGPVQAHAAPAASGVAIPALPVPIPLPGAPKLAPQEELPELELDAIEAEAAAPIAAAPVAAPAAQPAVQAAVQPARPAANLRVPREGDLVTVPLPRIVYELYVGTFTGVLHVSHPPASRSIYFWGGFPVRVDAQSLSETLGQVLLQHGRITMEQYNQSLETMRERGCRQGEALIAMGVMRESELLEALREQTERKLTSTFAWREGAYRIDERADFAKESVMSEVQPLKVIWRGVFEQYEIESLLGYFEPLKERFLVATELFPVHFEAIGPFLRELGIPDLLNGRTTISGALQTVGARLAPAIYVLLVTEMVRLGTEPGAAAIVPSKPQPSAAIAGDPQLVAEVSNEIAAEYLRLKECDLLDALRVDAAASTEEVDAAHQNIVAALRLDQLPPGVSEDLRRRAGEVRDILARARIVLRDAALRERYLLGQQERFTQRQVEQGPAAEEAGPPPQAQGLELAADRQAAILAQRAFEEGESLMASNRFEDAALKFQQAIESDGREPTYRVALGRALLGQGGVGDEAARLRAVTCLQQALQLDPSHVGANLEMARLLLASQNRDRAVAYLQRVVQQAPENQEARRLLASVGP